MAFFNFRWPGKKDDGDSSSASRRPTRLGQAESVDVMRRRARHRLIGAAVLVLAGVVGFPLLFDTQPRPIPVDIPIEIPDRDKVAPLVVPGANAVDAHSHGAAAPTGRVSAQASLGADEEEVPMGRPSAPSVPSVPVAPPVSQVAPVKPEAKPEAKPEPKPAAKPETKPEPKPEPKPRPEQPKPEHKPEPKPEPKPDPKPKPEPKPEPSRSDDAARARALLEGRSAPAASTAAAATDERFIVQVGAFSDAGKAQEIRAKLELAGLKTFTQVVDTKDGKRTRVRVGPFNGRAEADKAAARVKGQGLPASVLKL
ncbi:MULTISPECIES: SPOR domain-containing protein [Delftia]|uniref:SPOR domain-containing protein n=2 Tax=Delftia TaxID=80865 RepID=A0A7T2S3Z4_DELAC|nr:MULTISPECIES: SPOR domain-containing protein [Delftia]MBB1653015.1 sporulation protein [Delftia sp. UME58]QPS08439.1 SPOR domain-containing protein [Delftia acidovorans]